MVTRAEVLTKVKGFIKEGLNVRAVTTREHDGYTTSVMGRYQEGRGIGVFGSITLYEITHKTRFGADKTTEMINNLDGVGD